MIRLLLVLVLWFVCLVIPSMVLRSVAIGGINKGIILFPVSYEAKLKSLYKLF